MRAQERVLARKNIDKRLIEIRNSQSLVRPPRGWIKAIREALGMNSKQLAKRMGVSQPRASEIEKNEVADSLTLDTLQRAANALECQLVYAFIPRKPLQDLVEERADKLARMRLQATSHSMALEDQSVNEADAQSQLSDLVKKLAESLTDEDVVRLFFDVGGHDMRVCAEAFEQSKENPSQPILIIAHTIKGKGVSFMEGELAWHYKSPNDEQVAIALAELGDGE